jgi:hypothetical protein
MSEDYSYLENPYHPARMETPYVSRREILSSLRSLLAHPTPPIGGTLAADITRDGDIKYRWTDERGNRLVVTARGTNEEPIRRYFQRHENHFPNPGDEYPHTQPFLEAFAWKAILEHHGVTVEEVERELEMAERYPPQSEMEF